MQAAAPAFAALETLEELRRCVPRRLGVSAGDVSQDVGVTAAGLAKTRQGMPPVPPRNDLGGQVVVRSRHRPIADLDGMHGRQQRFEVVADGPFTSEEMERVMEDERYAFSAQERRRLEHVSPQRLDVPVVTFCEAKRPQVDARSGPGDPAPDLLAHHDVGRARVAVQQFQAPVDAVVVRQRDEVHPARARRPVDRLGFGIAVAAPKRAHVRREPGMDRVHVQVGPQPAGAAALAS